MSENNSKPNSFKTKFLSSSKLLFWVMLFMLFHSLSYILYAFNMTGLSKLCYRISFAPKTIALLNMIEDDTLPYSSVERLTLCIALVFSSFLASYVGIDEFDWSIVVELLLFYLAICFEKKIRRLYEDAVISESEIEVLAKRKIVIIAVLYLLSLLISLVIMYRRGLLH